MKLLQIMTLVYAFLLYLPADMMKKLVDYYYGSSKRNE